jgi:hypothetical protein
MGFLPVTPVGRGKDPIIDARGLPPMTRDVADADEPAVLSSRWSAAGAGVRP